MPFTAEQFGILAEKTLHFLLIIKKNGRIVTFNNRCGILFPIDETEKKARYITDYLIDEDVKIFNQSITSLNKQNSILSQSFSFATEKQGVLALKFNLTLYNDLIYAAGIDTTEEYKEHRALMTISKLTKTGAWYYNPKNKEMFWSKGCYLIKDLDPKTKMTRELGASFYPKQIRERIESYLDDLIKTKKPYEYTEKIITHKGNEKWVKVVAQPVIYKNKVVYVNGTIADVTDRHNYIEKLKYNEETKHLALKGIQSGLFDHHIEKNEVFYSADFKKMLGLPLDQDFVPEETFRKMIHPNDVESALKRHLENLEQPGNHYYNHYRLGDKKGTYKYYEVHGFRRKDEKGETVRMIGNLIDVHQRKLNEKTIQENKKRLEAMINSGMDYILLLNTDGEILMADNDSIEIIKRDFNVNPKEVTCRFVDVMPVNFKATFLYSFNEALQGNIIKKEIERITHKGTNQWLETKYIPIFSDKSEINSILLTFRDITEQKLAEIAIKESHLKEQELNSLKSNILSNFSHEIRTPLNGIMTVSSLLLDEKEPEERKTLLKYLEESKNRLLDTINNLSNFSDLEAIKNNLNLKEVDTNYTVETSYREYKHMAEAKNLGYQLELDPTCPQINIDEVLLKTALNNMIHNAIKYTSKGTINIKVDSQKSKNNVYISITDTGIGIEKENLKKIFDPFMQESIGINRKYEGTGIGLSLSRRYIEILGGKIKVKSKIGKGTSFTILIPKCL